MQPIESALEDLTAGDARIAVADADRPGERLVFRRLADGVAVGLRLIWWGSYLHDGTPNKGQDRENPGGGTRPGPTPLVGDEMSEI